MFRIAQPALIQNGRVEFYALRAIGVGEEITVNYGQTHHDGRLACRCGASNCAGACELLAKGRERLHDRSARFSIA